MSRDLREKGFLCCVFDKKYKICRRCPYEPLDTCDARMYDWFNERPNKINSLYVGIFWVFLLLWWIPWAISYEWVNPFYESDYFYPNIVAWTGTAVMTIFGIIGFACHFRLTLWLAIIIALTESLLWIAVLVIEILYPLVPIETDPTREAVRHWWHIAVDAVLAFMCMVYFILMIMTSRVISLGVIVTDAQRKKKEQKIKKKEEKKKEKKNLKDERKRLDKNLATRVDPRKKPKESSLKEKIKKGQQFQRDLAEGKVDVSTPLLVEKPPGYAGDEPKEKSDSDEPKIMDDFIDSPQSKKEKKGKKSKKEEQEAPASADGKKKFWRQTLILDEEERKRLEKEEKEKQKLKKKKKSPLTVLKEKVKEKVKKSKEKLKEKKEKRKEKKRLKQEEKEQNKMAKDEADLSIPKPKLTTGLSMVASGKRLLTKAVSLDG